MTHCDPHKLDCIFSKVFCFQTGLVCVPVSSLPQARGWQVSGQGPCPRRKCIRPCLCWWLSRRRRRWSSPCLVPLGMEWPGRRRWGWKWGRYELQCTSATEITTNNYTQSRLLSSEQQSNVTLWLNNSSPLSVIKTKETGLSSNSLPILSTQRYRDHCLFRRAEAIIFNHLRTVQDWLDLSQNWPWPWIKAYKCTDGRECESVFGVRHWLETGWSFLGKGTGTCVLCPSGRRHTCGAGRRGRLRPATPSACPPYGWSGREERERDALAVWKGRWRDEQKVQGGDMAEGKLY